MKIVLNTSPIIFLSKVNSLKLLADCIDDIYAPKAVIQELHEYTLPAFIKVRTLSATGEAYVQGALGHLHQGELEAIVLAQEIAVDPTFRTPAIQNQHINIRNQHISGHTVHPAG